MSRKEETNSAARNILKERGIHQVRIFHSRKGVFGVSAGDLSPAMNVRVRYAMKLAGFERVQTGKEPWMDNYNGVYFYKKDSIRDSKKEVSDWSLDSTGFFHIPCDMYACNHEDGDYKCPGCLELAPRLIIN